MALIRKWVASGMPRGRSARGSRGPALQWHLGSGQTRPGLIGGAALDFAGLWLRCLSELRIALPAPADALDIRAMEIRPAAPQVVHHANVLIDRTASWRRQHPDTWRDGVPGMELMLLTQATASIPDSHFLFWKPDTPALVEPEGMPWQLDAGNDLILNMHLKTLRQAGNGSPRKSVFTSPTRRHESNPCCCSLNTTLPSIYRPASATSWSKTNLNCPLLSTCWESYPHAHYLGKDLEAYAVLPGGRKVWLIWIRNWDIEPAIGLSIPPWCLFAQRHDHLYALPL